MTDFSKCALTRFPAPVLDRCAKPIAEINEDIRRLADRMIDIMVETEGVGLAGPQAGVNLRIFVVSLDSSRDTAKVYINPEIQTDGAVVSREEGCLSLPGIYSDLNGNRFTEEAADLLARVFQHEYDHLQGTMIKDRMSRMAKIKHRARLKELMDNPDADMRAEK
jgi:peptide deformylase